MTEPTDPHTCPRCRGGIPNNEQRGEYPGALSRADNKTEICSGCGVEEAMIEMHGGNLRGPEAWPLR